MRDATCTLLLPSLAFLDTHNTRHYTVGRRLITQKLCLAAFPMFLALQCIKKKYFYFNRSPAISAQVVSFLNITHKMREECLIQACCHGQKAIVVPTQTCRTPLATMGRDSDAFAHVMYLVFSLVCGMFSFSVVLFCPFFHTLCLWSLVKSTPVLFCSILNDDICRLNIVLNSFSLSSINATWLFEVVYLSSIKTC